MADDLEIGSENRFADFRRLQCPPEFNQHATRRIAQIAVVLWWVIKGRKAGKNESARKLMSLETKNEANRGFGPQPESGPAKMVPPESGNAGGKGGKEGGDGVLPPPRPDLGEAKVPAVNKEELRKEVPRPTQEGTAERKDQNTGNAERGGPEQRQSNPKEGLRGN